MSRKPAESKTRPDITEAVQRTESLIRGLQTRLAEPPEVEPPEAEAPEPEQPESEPPEAESAEELELELRKYFADRQAPGFPLSRIRQRVIEGVAEKLLAQWESSAIEREIVDTLVERVFERLQTARAELREVPKPKPTQLSA